MHHLLQLAAWAELALCWLIWVAAFVRPRKKGPRTVKVLAAPASGLGILLNFLGFACLLAYIRPAGYESPMATIIPAMLIAPLSAGLAWRASLALGKNWSYAAALNDDHELVTTGPYRKVRHPIYASMLGMMLATGGAYTWWPMYLIAAVLILLGIEIRVRAEERIMEQYFQDEYIEYRARTRAYLPF